MASDKAPSPVPASVQKEIRSKLGALGIKLTIAAESLQGETDPTRAQELRDQIAMMKAEAKTVVEKYRWAKTTHGEDAVPATTSELDGMLVFGGLDFDDASQIVPTPAGETPITLGESPPRLARRRRRLAG